MDFHLGQIKSILSDVKGRGGELAAAAKDKTRDAARLAKAAVELTEEKETLKKAYLELGKAFYEERRGTADGLFAQLCAEIDASNERLGALKAEIAALRGVSAEEGEDFESVVARAEEEPDIEVEITEEE